MTLWVRGCKEGLGSCGVPSHIPPLELPAPPVKKHVRGWRGRGQASLHDVWVWRQRPLCGSDEGREGPCWSRQRPAPPRAGSGERNPTPARPAGHERAALLPSCGHQGTDPSPCHLQRVGFQKHPLEVPRAQPGTPGRPCLVHVPPAPLKGSSPGLGDRRKVTVAGTEAVLMAASTRDSRGP